MQTLNLLKEQLSVDWILECCQFEVFGDKFYYKNSYFFILKIEQQNDFYAMQELTIKEITAKDPLANNDEQKVFIENIKYYNLLRYTCSSYTLGRTKVSALNVE